MYKKQNYIAKAVYQSAIFAHFESSLVDIVVERRSEKRSLAACDESISLIFVKETIMKLIPDRNCRMLWRYKNIELALLNVHFGSLNFE